MAHNNETIADLFKRSLSWEYYGGSHFQAVKHPEESQWRNLPFMVVVCPIEGLYYSRIDGIGLITIHPGEALIAPKNLKYTVAMPDGGILHHAHIQYNLFGSTDVMSYFKLPFLLKGEKSAIVSDITRDLHIAMTNDSSPEQSLRTSIKRMSLASQLLDVIIDSSENPDVSLDNLNEIVRIEPAIRYMEKHLADEICRRKLAKLSSLSETHFHSVFSKAIGIAPMTYLKNLRMAKAQILLFQTNLSIAEVGEQVAYPDIYHFSKIFKNTFSITPSAYRKHTRTQAAMGGTNY